MKKTVTAIIAAAVLLSLSLEARAQDPSWFVDVTDKCGLTGRMGQYIYAIDLDNDDYPDLVMYNNNPPTNRNQLTVLLNRQDPNSTDPKDRVFVDHTEASGINQNPDPNNLDGRQSSVVSFADVDNDGDTDVLTCPYYHRIEQTGDYDPDSRCEVLLNDGNAVFTIVQGNGLHELGLLNGTGISMLDYDLDGNIDIYIATFFQDYTNEIWGYDYMARGNGDGTFTDVSDDTGIRSVSAPLYGVNTADINNDGWQDIITSPYCRTRGSVFINNQDGTFTDRALQMGYNAHTLGGDNGQALCQWASMPADFDNDGDIDLFILLVHGGNDEGEGHSTIVLNKGAAENYALEWALDLIEWDSPQSSHRGDYYGSWIDMDSNGWRDLVMAQGHYVPTQDKLFFLYQTQFGYFMDITAEVGRAGVDRIPNPHGLTVLDYDLDGDDDIVFGLGDATNQMMLLQNDIGNEQNYIAIKLDPPEGVNRSGIGVRVKVKTGTLEQIREVYAGEGHFGTQSPFILNFGLGNRTVIESIDVSWQSTTEPNTVLTGVDANQRITIGKAVEPDAGLPDAGEIDGSSVPDASTSSSSGDSGCGCRSIDGRGSASMPMLLLLLGILAFLCLNGGRRSRDQG